MICLTEQELTQARETLDLLERSYIQETNEEFLQLLRDVLMVSEVDLQEAARISYRLAMLNRVRILQRMVNKGVR